MGIDPTIYDGVVVDDEEIEFTGEWVKSSSLRPFVGNYYFHDGNTGKGMRSAKFPFSVKKDGLHDVRVSFLPHGNRAGMVKYEILTAEKTESITIDQRRKSDGDNFWHSLGSFQFDEGNDYFIQVSNEDTEGFVIVDSARIIPLVP